MQVVNAFWRGDVLSLVSVVDGARTVSTVKASHCFYLRKSEATPALVSELSSSRFCTGLTDEGTWHRLHFKHDRVNYDVPPTHVRIAQFVETQRKVRTYEADVSPVRRFITERDVAIQRPRRCYVDIETDSRVPFSQKSKARVLVWTVIGEGDGTDVIAGVLAADDDAAERELLRLLWATLRRFDQVLAWNGDRFDFPMILKRSELHGLHGESRAWLWLDHLVLYKRMNASAAESGEEKQSMALEAVANAVLGEGKLDASLGSKSWDEWAAGGSRRGRLVDYCARDADLMRRIEARTGYVELLQTLCDATHTFADTFGINPTVQVEGFLMKLGRANDMRFPSHFGVTASERYEGAFVIPPSCKGYARDVHVGDFSGMYPSIITSWNMSLETYRPDVELREDVLLRPAYLAHMPVKEFELPAGHCVAAITDAVFATEPEGVLVKAVDEIGRLRSAWQKKKAALPPGTEEWKAADRRASAYKIARNSFYGVVGSPFSRFFKREIAESISQCGVWLIHETVAAARACGFDVIYGDTDSIFVRGVSRADFEAFVARCNAELYPKLLAEKGCKRRDVEIAYEKEFERVVLVTAKRYAGRYRHFKGTAATADSKPEVKGLEYKRGDVTRCTREMQAEAIAIMMSGDEPPPAEDFVPLIERWRERVLTGVLDLADVLLSKRLSKPLGEYARRVKNDGAFAAEQPHIAVARELKKRGADVGEGTKIEYVVTDGDSSPMRCVPACDYAGELDRFYLWESLVYPPTMRLLAAGYPKENWDRFADVRPPKPRRPRSAAAKPPAEDDLQGQLFGLSSRTDRPRNDTSETGSSRPSEKEQSDASKV